MKYFITTLRYLELKDFDSDFMELMPAVNITNRLDVKKDFLTETVQRLIGQIETHNILESNAFLFYEYEDDEKVFEGLSNIQILEIVLHWIDNFLKNSWIYKDNCIICDTAYLFDISNVSSLRLEYKHTPSSGELIPLSLNPKEMKELIQTNHKVEEYLYKKESTGLRFMLEKNFSRIGRSLLFIKQAREARNLAYKVSNYCAALETLFTTDNMELSHKLAERTAFFLQDHYGRVDSFSIIKAAYGIRSKLTHGASLDQKLIDKLPEISVKTDMILRTAINKILNSSDLIELFDSDNKRIDEYFMKLILN